MTGLLGGVLGLMDPLGGHVLAALIGPTAWAESKSGRMLRLIFGGCAAGTLLGGVMGAIIGLVASFSAPAFSLGLAFVSMVGMGFICASSGVVLFPFFVLFLELIRKTVDGDW